jgi:copper(I)-binding protein
MKALLLTAGLALAIAAPAAAASYRLGQLEVVQPWSRPAAAGTNGVGFMTLANHGKAADALVRVETPVAEKAELHSSSTAGGVMRMARQDRVPVAPGGQAVFGPGAYHVMFIKLAKPLKAGERLPATLVFASGARLKVDFAIGTGLAPPADHSQMSMDHSPMKMDH